MSANIEHILAQAKLQSARDAELKSMPFYQNTMAMIGHVGLLVHNRIKPRIVNVTLTDIIKAAALEPRIFEILPALLIERNDFVLIDEVPDDLTEVLDAINQNQPIHKMPILRGTTPEKYIKWLQQKKHQLSGE